MWKLLKELAMKALKALAAKILVDKLTHTDSKPGGN